MSTPGESITGFRLSPQQARLWKLQSAGGCAFPARVAISIQGPLEVETLSRALEDMARRHEILRTTFRSLPGMALPLQVVENSFRVPLARKNLREKDPRQQAVRVRLLFEKSMGEKDDLASGPTLRASLAALSADRHLLVLALPALCADTVSLQNLARELAEAYAACLAGEEVASEAIQYADAAEMLHGQASRGRPEAGEAAQDFSGIAALRLPLEARLSARGSFDPERMILRLPNEVSARLQELERRGGVSPQAFLLACWQILLFRLTGQADLTIGVARDGRPYAELHRTLGLFAEFAPLTASFGNGVGARRVMADAASWLQGKSRGLTGLAQREAGDALRAEETPPFFPASFEFADLPGPFSAGGVLFSVDDLAARIDRFKVLLSVAQRDGELAAGFHYDAGLFRAEDIERLAGQFQALLEELLRDPEVLVSRPDIVSEAERRRIESWVTARRPAIPEEGLVHHLFEREAARSPERVALVSGGERLTYGELNGCANQLARHLRARGIGPEARVALCLPRSSRMASGILGVLKAGAAWLPLDPRHPKERQAMILEDARASLLLTERALLAALPEKRPPALLLDEEGPALSRRGRENPDSTTTPASLAYVIYTSGATGRPKGVMVPHASLSHYVGALSRRLGVTEEDVYLHTATIAFSSSVRQLLLPLTRGAKLVVARTEEIPNPVSLFETIRRERVTIVDFVPSYWRHCGQALKSLDPERRRALLDNDLRMIISASEPLSSELPAGWVSGFLPGVRCANMYGQTETTGIVSVYPIPEEESGGAEPRVVPIGRPLAGTRLHVLDSRLRPAPFGVVGEIYVGGAGLARGYWNDPVMTAERFIPDLLHGDAGGRLYRTGDLGRLLPDGNIEFAGRADEQIKIRGFRVEAGEVETALNGHPAVRESAVAARPDASGEPRLVAYVVPHPGPVVASRELRAFLAEKLPDYMVPSAWVFPEALPLTPTGKVHRRALPSPEEESAVERAPFAAPRTETEEALCTIWNRLLRLERVGIHDNFFELGGQSLTGTQMLSRVRDAFGVELPWAALFEAPTLAEFAERVEWAGCARRGGQDRPAEEGELPVVEMGRDAPGGPAGGASGSSEGLREEMKTSHGHRLRRRIAEGEVLPFLGVYDVFSASIAARHYESLFVSGFSFAASFYGLPDIGFIAWSDIVAFTQRLRALLPQSHLLVDIDDGYGDAQVASHVVSLLEAAGASAVVLEDQRRPRRCGHLEGKQLLELDEFLPKLQAVLATRREMLVVARTDAGEAADILRRAEAFGKAGADAVLVDAVEDVAFLRAVRERSGRPVGFNQIAGGKSPLTTLHELKEAGVSLAIYSTPALFAVQEALERAMVSLKANDDSLRKLAGGSVDPARCASLLQQNLEGRDERGPVVAEPPVQASESGDRGKRDPLDRLSPAKRAPLELRLRKQAGGSSEPALRPRRDRGPAPLSFAQARLWFLDQLEPGIPVYNEPVVMRWTGRLDPAALQAALSEIVRRHEALRTTFASVASDPVQVVRPAHALDLPMEDLTRLPEADREREALRLAAEEILKPFDLARGPLLRVRLLRLGEAEHLFVLAMHHIASDAWSVAVLLRELAALYESFSLERPSSLPEPPIQYADFAVWQREWLRGEVLETQLSYWKRRLAGAPPLLELPTDRLRPAVQTFRGARHDQILGSALAEALQALSRRQKMTLFMTMLGAFQALLSRYTMQEDIVVGVPVAGRNRIETEELIGFFVNTLALRGDLSGDPTFRELLGRVREMALGAYAHQELPFEKLVEELQPQRSLSYAPLFQVMFQLTPASQDAPELPGLKMEPVPLPVMVSKFDLSLAIAEEPGGLSCSWTFNTDLFDPETILRMAGAFETLLEGFVADPDRRLSRIPLLREEERHRLLVEWNDTRTDSSSETCVHELFERQVERAPNAVTVEFEGERLTYRELDRRSNQLANLLRARGAGPEAVVGLCVERSLPMLVGLLGILKSGAAYLPLDPESPRERLAFMLHDAQALLSLSESRLRPRLPDHPRTLCLDVDAEQIARESVQRPLPVVTPDHLAYIIYTSGSTGKPKGVEISHRSLTNYTEMAGREYAIGMEDRVLQFASLSFDASVEEIFPCLTRGGTLVLRSEEMIESVPRFWERCRAAGITVLSLPTAYWHELAAGLEEASLPLPRALRLVIVGGERARPERLVLWQKEVGPAVRLVNGYGPTEATVVATLCDLPGSAEPGSAGREVPIGRPVSNAEVYILDRFLQPVPIGVAGELHIGGSGLARGYRNRPDLTAEKFIPHPFRHASGARLYRSGDLARYRPGGELEYLGRIGHQVKLRGFRVELEEIEAALREHPSVSEAVVLAREDRPDEKRLVAYVVAGGGPAPGARELRSHLQERLPDYMVPSAFVPLPSLPLTPSGKVDRFSLAPPDTSGLAREETYVSPSTPVEEAMARIWTQVLGIERVGVHDNFFEIGGHSLLATQVFTRMRDRFAVGLPLRMLFEAPTIAQLSAAIEKARAAGGAVRPQPILPVSRQVWLRQDSPSGPAGDSAGPDIRTV